MQTPPLHAEQAQPFKENKIPMSRPHGTGLKKVVMKTFKKAGLCRKFWIENDGISVKYNGSMNDRAVEDIMRQLVTHMRVHRWKNQKKFSICLGECDSITDKCFKTLGFYLTKAFDKLEHLELYFYECKGISDAGLVQVGSQVTRHFSTLKQLKISFYNCPKISDKGLNVFGNSLKENLTQLESISVYFGLCTRITDLAFQKFTGIVGRHMKNMKDLSLDFTGCSSITDSGFAHAMLRITRHLKKLQQLKLSFGNCQLVTDTSLELLRTYMITYSRMLKLLALNFRGQSFIDSKFINFKFRCKEVSDLSFIYLGSHNMKRLENLERIILDFRETKLTTKAKAVLAESLYYVPNIELY